MTENHFRLHFSPFQINTQLFFFWFFFTKWPLAAILDDRKSLSIAFLAILDQYAAVIFFEIFTKWPPAAILDDRKSLFRSHFSPFQINMQLFLFLIFFLQNGHRRPFWMTEDHFRSCFSPFQINTQLYFSTKWPPFQINTHSPHRVCFWRAHAPCANWLCHGCYSDAPGDQIEGTTFVRVKILDYHDMLPFLLPIHLYEHQNMMYL